MTYYDAYAARLRNRKFDWSDDRQQINPTDIEYLTKSFFDETIFWHVYTRIREQSTAFRKIDWGAWAIPVTKTELLSYLEEWKIGWELPEPGDQTHKPRLQRAKCKAIIEALPNDGDYILVIEEF